MDEKTLTEDERKFLNLFRKADNTEKIVIVAIMSSGSEEDGLDILGILNS